MSQRELGRAFQNGATEGKASNVQLMDLDDVTAVVGYGWAIYAYRDKETGTITAHRGWHGYSPSTSSQMTRMRLSHPADTSMGGESYESRADAYSGGSPRLVDV